MIVHVHVHAIVNQWVAESYHYNGTLINYGDCPIVKILNSNTVEPPRKGQPLNKGQFQYHQKCIWFSTSENRTASLQRDKIVGPKVPLTQRSVPLYLISNLNYGTISIAACPRSVALVRLIHVGTYCYDFLITWSKFLILIATRPTGLQIHILYY